MNIGGLIRFGYPARGVFCLRKIDDMHSGRVGCVEISVFGGAAERMTRKIKRQIFRSLGTVNTIKPVNNGDDRAVIAINNIFPLIRLMYHAPLSGSDLSENDTVIPRLGEIRGIDFQCTFVAAIGDGSCRGIKNAYRLFSSRHRDLITGSDDEFISESISGAHTCGYIALCIRAIGCIAKYRFTSEYENIPAVGADSEIYIITCRKIVFGQQYKRFIVDAHMA